MSQHSLQEHPQDPRKPCKSDELSSFFGFSLVLARSPPRSRKSRQDPPKSALKMPILGSMCAILATSWREVGQLSAILAPTWPILAPRCAQQASEGSPEHVPISTLGHLGARRFAKSLKTSPGPLFFQDFACILLPILSKVVENALENFYFIPALSVPPKPLQNVPETLPGRPQDAQTYTFKEFPKTFVAKRSKVTPTVVSKSS